MAQHLLPLSNHVEIELREQWDVGEHDEDEEGVVVEGEVVFVWESDRVQPCFLHGGQRGVDGQQLPGHAHRVQHNEERVPGPFDEVG